MRENDSVSRIFPFSEKIGENAAGMLIATPSRPENHNMKTMQTKWKHWKHEKSITKNYEVWAEPHAREWFREQKFFSFSEKVRDGMLANTDQGSQDGPTIGQAQWRDRRMLKKERPISIQQ